jgi:N4-gp56 family major capsid protein
MTMNYNDQTNLAYMIPKIWSAKLYQQMLGKFYFQRFTGPEGSGMPVIAKSELINQPGDSIYIQQVGNLTGAGITGAGMEGNEEQFSLTRVTLTPTWLRHAVAIDAPTDKQITENFRSMASNGLSRWFAGKMDTSKWTAATTTAACGFEMAVIETVYGGTATSVNGISASDSMEVDTIRETAALLRDDNVPGIMVPDLPGMDYYVMFINTFQALSLRQDADWQTIQKDANIRGSNNPMFTGALGEIEGVVIYETTQCGRTLNANSPTVYTSRAVMMGAEALAHGINENIVWNEDFIDYNFQWGFEGRAAWQDKVLSSNAIKHIVTSAVKPGE